MAALLDLRMPGVYTQEIPTLPPTVGVIPSAVPVFIGYTQTAMKKGESVLNIPTRVKSMREYEEWFGGPPLSDIEVQIDDRTSNARRPEARIISVGDLKFKMYHALLLYYANGGGPCFIISVGDFSGDPAKKPLIAGITPAVKTKDITIMVFPDGPELGDNNYKDVIIAALKHCEKMKNRVTIIDVNEDFGEDLGKIESVFQTNMPSDIDFKKYGMAYYPYLDTGLSYAYSPDIVSVKEHLQTLSTADAAKAKTLSDAATAGLDAMKTASGAVKAAEQKKTYLDALKKALDDAKVNKPAITNAELNNIAKETTQQYGGTLPDAVRTALESQNDDVFAPLNTEVTNAATAVGTATTEYNNKKTAYTTAAKAATDGVDSTDGTFKIKVYTGSLMSALNDANNLIYGKIKDAIQNFPVRMPPAAAIAGIYVRTDATQGVWKAPANVSVFGAIKPSLDLDDDMHAELNAPSNGKAINVIRTYPGRGLLVYGARTLAGNDLEWRYVNVRRTFCFIEDSVARAMQDFVFEPNTPQTWIKVKSMIKSFLHRLWKAGGLYGNTPEDAYDVIVGEPDSMSIDDILNGIMRVFIKVAVARPAEFIVLQYEHKFELAEA
jgi:uncharacterized protein